MFLDATDEVLLRRFSETRRRHPLSGDDLRRRRAPRSRADGRAAPAARRSSTPSNLNMHQLKAIIQDRYGGTGKLAVTLVSFGFKHGLPLEFDLVFDVRFLPNPYFEPTLTHLDGRDPEVAKFVFGPDGIELVRQSRGPAAVRAAAVPEGGQAVRHRSASAAPAAGTARSPSSRSCAGGSAGDWDILVRHRDVERGE